jgi:hypothetical protein
MFASRSRTHILADWMLAYIPTPVLRLMPLLPTAAFQVIRKSKALTNQLGQYLVNGKLETARRGLEMNIDIYSALRSFPFNSRPTDW